MKSAQTERIDAEYFQRRHLGDESLVAARPTHFQTFAQMGLSVEGSAFYPAIEEFYGTGNLPFLRVADVDSVIDFQNCTKIPASLCNRMPTLRRVYPGDIVFTKGGSVARIGLVTEEAAASRDLIFFNSSQLPEADRIFLYLYAQTPFFNRMLVRSSSQTAQPHLTITLVRNLPVFRGSNSLKRRCVEVVSEAYSARAEAISTTRETEAILEAAVGLRDWRPPEPLAFSLKASEVLARKRLDSQFFAPRYAATRHRFEEISEVRELRELGKVLKGESVAYDGEGTVPIIRSGDLVDISDDSRFLRALASEPIFEIERGDVLISSIGFGSIGKVQVFDREGRYGTVSEVTVVRQKTLNPYYLAAFLRSPAGQSQIERFITGATGQLHLYPRDVGFIFIPMLPKPKQDAFQGLAEKAQSARHRSRDLLAAAQRSVEIAIEESEQAAMSYLNSTGD